MALPDGKGCGYRGNLEATVGGHVRASTEHRSENLGGPVGHARRRRGFVGTWLLGIQMTALDSLVELDERAESLIGCTSKQLMVCTG